jgi:MoxR-like ATPase
MVDSNDKPRWVRDLLRYIPLKSQFVLSGNIRDHYSYEISPGLYTSQPLVPFLANELRLAGYVHILAYDPVHGFREMENGTGAFNAQSPLLQQLSICTGIEGDTKNVLEQFSSGLESIVNRTGDPIALIADFASRIVNRPDSLATAEQRCFTRALVLSHDAKSRPCGTPPKPFYNSVIWIVDKEGDLPDWFIIANPRIRHIPVPKPDHVVRRQLCTSLIKSLDGAKSGAPEVLSNAVNEFVESTEGMLLVDLVAISQLARTEKLQVSRISEAVRHYKLGVTEDLWMKIDRAKIAQGGEIIRRRIKGQNHAIIHMLDIIKRAVTGVGASRRGGRPRGVAFLAGPTGVGKTELAKTITNLLFGDDSAYIRFDMSEFSAEHSDQRLLGAPPGYIGYDVGGELTNAIREKPFCVLLFDEIEKAHPRILDKFLQILDDGVLTSGRGDRVYFSEAFIIFTSNLGIYRIDSNGERVLQVSADDAFEDVAKKVRFEIEQHFKLTLGRPEILNRIGENIIVFDFIREDVALAIFEQMVNSTLEDLKAVQQIRVTIPDDARDIIRKLVLNDLSNGGRGIRNRLEAQLVNPLARALFDQGVAAGAELVVSNVVPGEVTSISLNHVF